MKSLNVWECRKTGDCCKRFHTTGPLVEKAESKEIIKNLEKKEIANHLKSVKITTTDVLQSIENNRSLPLVDGTKTCAFLNENNECIIHEIKPKRCQTYPLIISETDDGVSISIDSACPRGNQLAEEVKNNKIPKEFSNLWINPKKAIIDVKAFDFPEAVIREKEG